MPGEETWLTQKNRGVTAVLAANVAFGCLHRDVPQEKLDLLPLASRSMAEPITGPSLMLHAA